MTEKSNGLSAQMKALKSTDLSSMIKISGLMVPKLVGGFLPKLDEKQRGAYEKVFPVDGKKKIFIHLAETPTPPIVIRFAHPMKLKVSSVEKVSQQEIKGLTLTPEVLQLAMDKKYVKFLWRIKGQIGTLFSMAGMFMPFVGLGPKGIKDMQQKAMTHFKPLMDMMPGAKKY